MPDPLIPERFWQRLRKFLADRSTGQAVLHIVQGAVVGLDCKDILRLSPSRGTLPPKSNVGDRDTASPSALGGHEGERVRSTADADRAEDPPRQSG